jgi:hypothetical protein
MFFYLFDSLSIFTKEVLWIVKLPLVEVGNAYRILKGIVVGIAEAIAHK